MVDVSSPGKLRDNNQRNPWPVPEEVQRLNVAGVPVPPAFVESDDQCRTFHQFWIGLEVIENLLGHPLKQIELRRSRVAIQQPVWFYEGNCRQRSVVDGSE